MVMQRAIQKRELCFGHARNTILSSEWHVVKYYPTTCFVLMHGYVGRRPL